MKITTTLLVACLLPGILPAQQDIPLLRPEERKVVDGQADEFNQALASMLEPAAKSTVRVWSGQRRLAYGTVIGDGTKVLTKLSEVARAAGGLRIDTGDGSVRPVVLVGIYQNDDLAVLKIQGEPLTPVQWFDDEPKPGSFLTAPQPSGQPAAFGVVSVPARNLRETDKAYLGVQGDPGFAGPGVRALEVMPDSGAAAAGLQAGDVILRVNDREISGVLELRNSLTHLEPGARLVLSVQRGGKQIKLDAELGNRPQTQQFSGQRLQMMEQMGGPTSRVRDSFSDVIQSDMRMSPNQIGGPVVDLKGRVVGITMARADRTRSFVMPSAAIKHLLQTQPVDPSLAQADEPELPVIPLGHPRAPGRGMQREIAPAGEDQLRRHLSDMQRLMDRMREEMDRLEQMNR